MRFSVVGIRAQLLLQTISGVEAFRLQINSGYCAGQRVFHVHAHFLVGAELAE